MNPYHMMDRFNWSGGGYFGMFFMLIFWLAFIAGTVVLVVWLVNQLSAKGPSPGDKTAIDILKDRYARGEISKEEFEEKKKDVA